MAPPRNTGRLARWCEAALSPQGPASMYSALVVSAIVVVGTMLYVLAVLPAQAARRWWQGRS